MNADLIWRKGTPFEAMTGRTALSSDGLLAGVFRGFPQPYGKCQERRAQPRDSFIIIIFISDRRDWRDTRGKWPLAGNPDRIWWHRHTSLKLFCPQPITPWITGLLIYSIPPCPFLLSPFLACCVILLTSLVGKESHLRWWLVIQPLCQTVS